MAELIPNKEPKKFNLLPLIALGTLIVVLVGVGVLAICANQGTAPWQNSDINHQGDTINVEEVEPIQPISITGETGEVNQDGLHVTVQPKDLALTPSKPFGISITVEIMDDINPEIKELRFPTISDSLAQNYPIWGDNLLSFKEDWEASSDAITVDSTFEYRIQGFVPGDTITFTLFGTCPKDADVTESTKVTTVTNQIMGYLNPEDESYDSVFGLATFDYNITIAEEYSGEVRHSLNYALNEARMETLNPEKRFELLSENLNNVDLDIDVENMDNGVVNLHMPNGDVFEVNLNPEHDGEQIFDH